MGPSEDIAGLPASPVMEHQHLAEPCLELQEIDDRMAALEAEMIVNCAEQEELKRQMVRNEQKGRDRLKFVKDGIRKYLGMPTPDGNDFPQQDLDDLAIVGRRVILANPPSCTPNELSPENYNRHSISSKNVESPTKTSLISRLQDVSAISEALYNSFDCVSFPNVDRDILNDMIGTQDTSMFAIEGFTREMWEATGARPKTTTPHCKKRTKSSKDNNDHQHARSNGSNIARSAESGDERIPTSYENDEMYLPIWRVRNNTAMNNIADDVDENANTILERKGDITENCSDSQNVTNAAEHDANVGKENNAQYEDECTIQGRESSAHTSCSPGYYMKLFSDCANVPQLKKILTVDNTESNIRPNKNIRVVSVPIYPDDIGTVTEVEKKIQNFQILEETTKLPLSDNNDLSTAPSQTDEYSMVDEEAYIDNVENLLLDDDVLDLINPTVDNQNEMYLEKHQDPIVVKYRKTSGNTKMCINDRKEKQLEGAKSLPDFASVTQDVALIEVDVQCADQSEQNTNNVTMGSNPMHSNVNAHPVSIPVLEMEVMCVLGSYKCPDVVDVNALKQWTYILNCLEQNNCIPLTEEPNGLDKYTLEIEYETTKKEDVHDVHTFSNCATIPTFQLDMEANCSSQQEVNNVDMYSENEEIIYDLSSMSIDSCSACSMGDSWEESPILLNSSLKSEASSKVDFVAMTTITSNVELDENANIYFPINCRKDRSFDEEFDSINVISPSEFQEMYDCNYCNNDIQQIAVWNKCFSANTNAPQSFEHNVTSDTNDRQKRNIYIHNVRQFQDSGNDFSNQWLQPNFDSTNESITAPLQKLISDTALFDKPGQPRLAPAETVNRAPASSGSTKRSAIKRQSNRSRGNVNLQQNQELSSTPPSARRDPPNPSNKRLSPNMGDFILMEFILMCIVILRLLKLGLECSLFYYNMETDEAIWVKCTSLLLTAISIFTNVFFICFVNSYFRRKIYESLENSLFPPQS